VVRVDLRFVIAGGPGVVGAEFWECEDVLRRVACRVFCRLRAESVAKLRRDDSFFLLVVPLVLIRSCFAVV